MNARERRLYKRPYKNMAARKTVLMIGLVISTLSLLLVAFGAMLFFIPSMIFFENKLTTFLIIFCIGAALAFVGIVFAVAGANTSKPIAKIAFTLALVAFFVAAGFVVALALFKTVLPIPAFEDLWPK